MINRMMLLPRMELRIVRKRRKKVESAGQGEKVKEKKSSSPADRAKKKNGEGNYEGTLISLSV